MLVKVEGGCLPKRAHPWDAGLDLCSAEDVEIKPGELKGIRTGIRIALPKGTVGLIKDRSGMAKKGLHVLAGVIDPNYRGEIIVLVKNLGNEVIKIKKGERFAQILIIPIIYDEAYEVNELPESERGDKGFGSTGL